MSFFRSATMAMLKLARQVRKNQALATKNAWLRAERWFALASANLPVLNFTFLWCDASRHAATFMQETSDRRFKPTTRLRVDIAHKDNGTEEVLHGYTLSGSQTQLQNSSLFCTKPHPCKSRRRDSGFVQIEYNIPIMHSFHMSP